MPGRSGRDARRTDEPRRSKHLREPVPGRVADPHVVRRIEKELEEQALLVRAVADLPDAEAGAIDVGDERVLDAALGKNVVLHPHDEQMLERPPAELQHAAGPDQWAVGSGQWAGDRGLLDGVYER